MTTGAAGAERPPGANTADVGKADENVAAILAALADPTRRQLLGVLVDVGRASATYLAARLPVSRQAVVKHLQVLARAGLVERVRAGREVLYTARRDPLDASARWLADLSATWDTRLRSLKRAAETAADD